MKAPTVVVLHYTAGASFDGARNWLYQKSSGASAHFLVGRDGKSEVIVPPSTVAWHAGVSKWKGREKVNTFGIGIELVNLGPIEADGRAVATGKPLPPADIFEAPHKLPACGFKRWQRYTEPQVAEAQRIVNALLTQYPTLTDLVDHSDVSGFRGKWDAGPALQFSMDPASRSASISCSR